MSIFRKLLELSAYAVWLSLGVLIGEFGAEFQGAGSWPQILIILGVGMILGAVIARVVKVNADSVTESTPSLDQYGTVPILDHDFNEEAIQIIMDTANSLRRVKKGGSLQKMREIRETFEEFLERHMPGGEG